MGQYRERADVRVYLEIILSLITVSVFSIFALRPTLLTIAELIREIQAKKSVVTKIDEKISNLSKAQILLDQKRVEVDILNFSIPKGPDPDIFARQIEGLSIKHNSPLVNMTLNKATILGRQSDNKPQSDETLPEDSNQINFSVSTAIPIDQYTALGNFISDLENLRRPIKIDKVTINANKEEDQIMLISVIDGRLPFFLGEYNNEK